MKESVFLVRPALLIILCLAGCSRGGNVLSDQEAYRRFVGTWVNTEYPGTRDRSQVAVIRPDYAGEHRLLADSSFADGVWKIEVKKTWVDRNGNTYCQCNISYFDGSDWTGTALMRVDKRRKVWEINSRKTCQHVSIDDLAGLERIDPLMGNYWIYYRK